MKTEAIIFDCDGVIVDSEAIHVDVEIAFLAELGLVFDRATYLSSFLGLGMPEFTAALTRIFAEQGLGPFPSDFRRQLHARAWPQIEDRLVAIPGVIDFAEAFDGPKAIASSSPSGKLARKLEIVGLNALFQPHIYSADQVARSKPAPDLFLLTSQKISTPPERCLVIEDSVNGVHAAISAGMPVIGYTGGGHINGDPGHTARLKEAGALAVYSDFAAIKTMLDGA